MRRLSFAGIAAVVLAVGAAAGPSAMNAVQPENVCPRIHYVTWGETLYKIGVQYGVWWTDLAVANNLSNPDRIYVGQTLTIPCTAEQQAEAAAAAAPSPASAAPAGNFDPSQLVPYDASLGPPPGCYLSDGNACYGTSACSSDQDYIRGKETCIFLGLGSNESPPDPELPLVYGGVQLIVNGRVLGGRNNKDGPVCGLLVLKAGSPTVDGVQAVRTKHDSGSIDEAVDDVKFDLRGLHIDCSGGYDRAVHNIFLGPTR